jgi:tetratricopeptide (TPR) repeat protein
VSARTALAYTDLYFRWNQPLAEQRFQRVLRQAPMSAIAHQWYGNLLIAEGRGADAVREMRRAATLDPQSVVAGAAVGWALYHQGRYEEAVARCQAILDLDPTCAVAHLWQGLAWQELGRWPDALAALRRARALFGDSSHATAALARALAAAGQTSEARELLDPLLARLDYLPSYEIAKALLALGQPNEALGWLERAHRERSHSMVFLAVDPQLERLRPVPRFRALLLPHFDRAS